MNIFENEQLHQKRQVEPLLITLRAMILMHVCVICSCSIHTHTISIVSCLLFVSVCIMVFYIFFFTKMHSSRESCNVEENVRTTFSHCIPLVMELNAVTASNLVSPLIALPVIVRIAGPKLCFCALVQT